MRRRSLLRVLGGSAVAGAAWAAAGCSSGSGRPRSKAEARRAVAAAIFGSELVEPGLEVMGDVRLSSEQKLGLDELVAAAKRGVDVDGRLLDDHEDLVRRLLRGLWGDDSLLWPAVGYPHGPGICTVADLYTRPPREAVEADRKRRKAKRS